ncbi:reverse transcriptase domain-containing protein [Tanacetum coccineum]
MPSYIGSYDGKGDPNNYLHLFEWAIRMQKWSHFSQQKKFTKTHLVVHNIKQREGESTRAFATRYTDDTLQILGLHEDQHISGFVHGLRTQNFVEFLSTDLPPTYKGLIEKTYTLIEVREIEEAVKSRQLSHLVNGIKKEKAKASDTQQGEGKKDKGIVPDKALILIISRGEHYTRSNTSEEPTFECREITFPPVTGNNNSSALVIIKARIFRRQVNRVYMDNESSCEVIYEHCFLKLKPSIRASRVDSKVSLIRLSGEHSWPIREVHLEITICNAPFSRMDTLNFVIYESDKVKEGLEKVKKASPTDVKGIFSCTNVEEKVESLSGFLLKCFLDSYKGYHQIHMVEEDKDKTSFFAGEGTFCYRKMPLGLKNVRATYQRLVDKVSSYQIGRNLEAYVDDMVIRSTSEEDMLKDIQETLERYSKDVQTKKHTMDARGRRSPPKNEEVYGNLANTHLPSKGRSSNNVPQSFDKKHKRNPFYRKTRRTSPHLLGLLGQNAFRRRQKGINRENEHRVREYKAKQRVELYIDGASSSDGSGVGLMLINPRGKKYTYALGFEFKTTNNEAEYEALLAGLQIAQGMEIESLVIFTDYHLIVNQIKEAYEARNHNKKADALSKLASMTFEHLTKEVLVEVLAKRSIDDMEVLQVEVKEGENWMTPIHEYLLSGLLLEDPRESRKIIIKAPQYKLIKGSLHKKSFFTSWLHCIAPPQVSNIITEIHEGSCGFNAEPRSMVVKITKLGYFWPSMHRDVAKIIQDCAQYKEQSMAKKIAGKDVIAAGSKETPFSLTYGSEAIIPIVESIVSKDIRDTTKENAKRKESKEVASIEEAYYQNKLRIYHDVSSNHSTYKLGDFVLLSLSDTESLKTWHGPHMISKVYEGELYKITDASDHSLIQIEKGTSLDWVLIKETSAGGDIGLEAGAEDGVAL